MGTLLVTLIDAFGTLDAFTAQPSRRIIRQDNSAQFPQKGLTTLSVGSDSEDAPQPTDSHDICGPGFYKQTGPDGDYCVFDYKAAAAKFGTDQEHMVEDSDHYWDSLQRQNKSRQKFGLPPLTPEQYVALKAQSAVIGEKQIADGISKAFDMFDENNDGVVTIQEFKRGLESLLERDLTESSVRRVFDHYDTSGDGLLQPEEFVTVEQLKVKLRHVIRAEKDTQETSSSSGLFSNLMQKLAFHLEDKCESNFDCEQPEVCCDFGYKKMCCSSGQMAHDLQLEYATVPVPQASGFFPR